MGANVKELRMLYDKIEGNVRALNSLGVLKRFWTTSDHHYFRKASERYAFTS